MGHSSVRILAPLQNGYPLGRRDARAETSPIHTFSSTPKHGRSILLGFGTLLSLLTRQILTIQVDKYKVSCWRDGSKCPLTTKPLALPLWHPTPPSLRRIRHLPRKHHTNHQSSCTRKKRSLTFGYAMQKLRLGTKELPRRGSRSKSWRI